MTPGAGILTAAAITYAPASVGDTRRGQRTTNAHRFLACKRLIRDNPGWDDAEVAAAAGLHPVFDLGLVRTARNDVECDQLNHHTDQEYSFGQMIGGPW